MLQVFTNTNLRLMWGTKYVFMVFSTLAMTVAIGAMVVRGFNYGIDFAGGTAVQVKFRQTPHVDELRAELNGASLGDVNIQTIGEAADNEVLIRIEQQATPGAAGGEGGQISGRILAALRTPEERAAAQAGRLALNMASETEISEWLGTHLPGDTPGPEGPEKTTVSAAVSAALVRYRTEHKGLFNDLSEVASIPGVTPEAAALLKQNAILGSFTLRSVEFVGPT
ncbi:MAG TPA: hypothetical protein VFT43_14250, partial [Candidatus Polarisedimenticolia bacterium]|nr:hypothetical protein [Candidatus Polarisedimenticolia bacterium]